MAETAAKKLARYGRAASNAAGQLVDTAASVLGRFKVTRSAKQEADDAAWRKKFQDYNDARLEKLKSYIGADRKTQRELDEEEAQVKVKNRRG